MEREGGEVNEVTRTVKGTVLQLPKFKDQCKSIMSHFYKSSFSFALILFYLIGHGKAGSGSQ